MPKTLDFNTLTRPTLQLNGDMTTVQACYDLAARLMSCNRSGIKVTTEDLRGKYQINLEALIIFYNAYIDFIEEVTNQKN